MGRLLPGLLAMLAGVVGAALHAVNAAAGRTVTPSFWGMGLAAALGYGLLAVVMRDAQAGALRRLVAGIGLAQGVALVASEWALLGPDVTGRTWATWLGSWVWAVGYAATLALLPLLLPDGTTPGRRWRPAVWLSAAAVAWTSLSWALTPYDAQDFPGPLAGSTNPVGTDAVTAAPVPVAGGVLLLVAIVVALASLVHRWRRARDLERQQLKWILVGVAATLLLVVLARLLPVGAAGLLAAAAMLPLPLTIGVAVLRHGLWDVDLVISRGLLYVSLSATVLVGYLAVVWLAGSLVDADASPGLSAVTAALVALAVLPLRSRLQRLVNRLVHGDADEPYAVLARLGDRLGAAAEPEELAEHALPAVVEQVCRSLRARGAVLVLADGSVAAHGERPGSPAPLQLPLEYAGRQVGRLEVTRVGGFGFDDRRVLGRLAEQAAVAAHTVLLAREARAAREQVVVAREEERRRLRRDLHDGVGPSLAAVALQVETARDLTAEDPHAAAALLDRLVPRLNAAVADVRALVHDLRPPTLDELGLASAVRELAGRLSTAATRVDVAAGDLGDLPAAVEVAAYRIAAEAVTNAVRHAGAGSVHVRLVREEAQLLVEVVDDGRGMGGPVGSGTGDADERDGHGVGLTSMRARAEELGGSLDVARGPAGGTVVWAVLPTPPARSEAPVMSEAAPAKPDAAAVPVAEPFVPEAERPGTRVPDGVSDEIGPGQPTTAPPTVVTP